MKMVRRLRQSHVITVWTLSSFKQYNHSHPEQQTKAQDTQKWVNIALSKIGRPSAHSCSWPAYEGGLPPKSSHFAVRKRIQVNGQRTVSITNNDPDGAAQPLTTMWVHLRTACPARQDMKSWSIVFRQLCNSVYIEVVFSYLFANLFFFFPRFSCTLLLCGRNSKEAL